MPATTRLQMMDTNKDGMISAAEHTAGSKARCSGKLDADGDGRVTAAEWTRTVRGARTPAESRPSQWGRCVTAAEHEKGSRGMFTEWMPTATAT